MVPMNLTLDTGMILAAARTNPVWTIFAQVANQTYNACHYYANRNATHVDSSAQRVAAYTLATSASVTAAIGLQSMGPPGSLARVLAPWTAVCVANALNLPTVRASEWISGVEVRDADDGAPCGFSRRCGSFAVGVCVFSRVAAATPTLVLPPIALAYFERRRGAPLQPLVRVPLLLGMIGGAMCCGVPLVFGLFAQTSTLSGAWCETSVLRPDGKRPRAVTFNRGL
ncbi:Tricarboxylate/iron carrier [Pavlovales sp. CCMP2436]|nr:Tricarboxylate/iron carrier [Pavlovales sp. CCMP2436]